MKFRRKADNIIYFFIFHLYVKLIIHTSMLQSYDTYTTSLFFQFWLAYLLGTNQKLGKLSIGLLFKLTVDLKKSWEIILFLFFGYLFCVITCHIHAPLLVNSESKRKNMFLICYPLTEYLLCHVEKLKVIFIFPSCSR